MQNHSDKWTRYAANGDFRMDTRAVIGGVEYSTITAPVIVNGLLPGKELSVGNCISGTCTFTVMTNNPIPRSGEVVIKGRIIDDEHYTKWQNGQITESEAFSEWLEFGHFWIDKRTINDGLEEKLIDLECFDAMLKGNQAYSDNSQALEWPKPMQTVVTRIAEQMGVQIDSRTVIKTGTDYVVYKPDDDATLLDILRWIGEIHGGNWTITPDNKLRLVPLISAPSETFYVIDENRRRIKTPEGDNLAWKSGEQLIMPDGIGYINVPVVLGDMWTYNLGLETNESSRALGAYTLISGSYNGSAAATYFQGIVGNDETVTGVTNNYYSSGTGQIVVFRYDMPVTIPDLATISRVYLKVKGKPESTVNANEYMCVRLVSGSTYLSDEYNFKSSGTTSLTTYTLECNVVPTVEQLASMQIECRLGFYGGNISGASVYVEYEVKVNKQITKVTMARDQEHVYTAGTDGGIEIKIQDNPSATQNLCDVLYSELNGLEYAPYEVTKAVYDPTVELGDMIFVGSTVHSIIYTANQRFDLTYQADVAAPGEEELDSEYPYQSVLQKNVYNVEKTTALLRSEIRQTQDEIDAEVTRATTEEGVLSGMISVNASNIDLKVSKNSVIAEINLSTEQSGGSTLKISADKLNLTGYATFSSLSTAGQTIINGSNIHGGTITLGGNNNINGSITINDSDDNIIGTWDENGINITKGTIDIGDGNFTVDSQGNLNAIGTIMSEYGTNWIKLYNGALCGGANGSQTGQISFGNYGGYGDGMVIQANVLYYNPTRAAVMEDGGYWLILKQNEVLRFKDYDGRYHSIYTHNGLVTGLT